jgi:hypothetical protein
MKIVVIDDTLLPWYMFMYAGKCGKRYILTPCRLTSN